MKNNLKEIMRSSTRHPYCNKTINWSKD